MCLFKIILFGYYVVICTSVELEFWRGSALKPEKLDINVSLLKPPKIPRDITSLAAKRYYLDEPEINKVMKFNNLRSLYLDGIGQKNLPQFAHLHKLTLLSLGFNDITAVPKNHISTLSVLHIILTNNKISRIDAGAFGNDVTEVNLNCNYLIKIESNWFLAPEKLQALHLDGNQIEKIGKGLFDKFDSLRSIFLRHNSLRHIQDEAFSNRYSFSILDFAYNKLISFKSTIFDEGDISIDELNISFNNLTYLSKDFLARVTVVNTPHIDGNPWQCSCYYHHIIKWISWHNYGNLHHKTDRPGEPRCVTLSDSFDDSCMDVVNYELINIFTKNASPPPENREQYCTSKNS